MARHAKSAQEKQDLKSLVTLEDVAKAAGVTAMTVSRAIKGTGYVAPATRDKVLRMAAELNYVANPSARALATGRTGVIAIVTGELYQAYYANLVHLLESQIIADGFQIRLLRSKSELKDVMNATTASAVDGVIVSGIHDLSEEAEFLNYQLARFCVFLDTFEHPNTDYVRIDLREAVEEALEHMIASGRKRIAYAGVSDDSVFDPSSAVEDRLLTYLSVMERTGQDIEFINSRLELNQTARIHALRGYFETHGCPEGIICLHDEIMVLVYRALRDCGYRIPEDVLLVGCDGLPLMECFDPPLSAISHPLEEATALAWLFLKTRIENPHIPLQQATRKAELVVRKSLQP